MFRVFEGRTADEAWQKIASAIRTGDGTCPQGSRFGDTREILHAAISIDEPRQRWVGSRNPPINLAFALAEVIWIMAGRKGSAFLNYFNRDLPKYAGLGPTYHGAYGYRLRKGLKLDQLERAFYVLKNNPDSRQVVLQIWDGNVDFPSADGRPVSEDVPCNVMAMLKVRGGALEWTQIMRSNDIFRGLPYNFVQFTTMQEIVAGWLDLKVGSYNHISDSLHVYERELDQIGPSVPIQVSENVDSLALTKTEFDSVLGELERVGNAVTDEAATAKFIMGQIENCNVPIPYRNILCVLCAEGVRKRKHNGFVDEIMGRCTNTAYRQLYTRWLARFAA